jgi:glycosyltransferase involved in cell wall biosynthesis
MTGHLCRVYGESLRAKVVVIPTRVDMSVFRKAKKVYERGAVLRIISVGSFIALKNHIALIRDLRATGVAFRLTLVGTGPLQNEYDRVIEELGCRDDVVFAGTVTHEILASLLREHDLYVHYSRSEGLSRAILEAMAVGLPVVATRVGFIGGVLNDAQNCLVIDPPWSSSLAEALKRLASSEPLRRQLGENARNTIEARFESNAVFDVYRKAVLGAARAIRVMT